MGEPAAVESLFGVAPGWALPTESRKRIAAVKRSYGSIRGWRLSVAASAEVGPRTEMPAAPLLPWPSETAKPCLRCELLSDQPDAAGLCEFCKEEVR
jgi:hypothetical protein